VFCFCFISDVTTSLGLRQESLVDPAALLYLENHGHRVHA